MSNILDNTAAVAFTCPYCHTQAAGLDNAGGMTCPRCSTTMERSKGAQGAAVTDSRKAAEQAYTVSAFDYPSAPVGSRDWCLFWKGWQAAEKNDVYQETVAWQTARANHAERDRDSWKAKAEANERDAERYEWLIRHLPSFHAILFDGATPLMYRGRYLKTPDEINAAIDAAISAEKEKE